MPEDKRVNLLPQTPRASGADVLRNVRPASPVRSLYIHVPFCFHKCHYCDFYSIVDTRDRQPAFVARLRRELEALAPLAAGAPLRTIFVGGGTPSLLAADLWSDLLSTLARAFDLSEVRAGRGEFTVECNPETVTPRLTDTLRAGGVNRVSVGAQSFDRAHLSTLERWHDPDNVGRALETARSSGITRASLDLIFAIPGQTLDHWRRDLDLATALGTEHLSCYCLTFEPGTALEARRARGDISEPPEELQAEMIGATHHALRELGLRRYEISNFSRPGAECRHNLAYWRQENWLAAGPSASGHIDGRRWKNTPRLDDYLERSDGGFAPVTEHEAPDPSRNLTERIMTGLRLDEGVDSGDLLRRASSISAGCADAMARAAERQAALGFLDVSRPAWRLTDAGVLIADSVILALAESIDGP